MAPGRAVLVQWLEFVEPPCSLRHVEGGDLEAAAAHSEEAKAGGKFSRDADRFAHTSSRGRHGLRICDEDRPAPDRGQGTLTFAGVSQKALHALGACWGTAACVAHTCTVPIRTASAGRRFRRSRRGLGSLAAGPAAGFDRLPPLTRSAARCRGREAQRACPAHTCDRGAVVSMFV